MTKKQKRRFADVIIIICILMALAITAVVLYEYHRLDEVLPSGVVSALLFIWGGELLIIALRQIFGSDVVVKMKQKTDEYNQSI